MRQVHLKLDPSLPWRERALCAPANAGYARRALGLDLNIDSFPDLFFNPDTEKLAKAICSLCEVRQDCLKDSLKPLPKTPGTPGLASRTLCDGVWGGKTKPERLTLYRERKAYGNSTSARP